MAGLIFFSIFLLGLGMLAGLILGIVGLATSKRKLTAGGFISFGLSLILMVALIIYSINRAVSKVKEFAETSMQGLDSLGNYEDYGYDSESATEDLRKYLLHDSTTTPAMKYIREESDKKASFIHPNYFIYFGTSQEPRYPLIYPYAIHCWDSGDFGTLVNEEKVVDIRMHPGKEENVVFNIHRFAFDDKYILLKTCTVQGDTSSAVFMLYDMDKKTSDTFDTQDQLMKAAKKAGYSGDQALISLWEYDKKF